MTDALIYHLADADAFAAAQLIGSYEGTPVDRADGFIHFSTAATVRESAAKHRAGQPNLLLLAVDPKDLGPALKWEAARGGVLFPHLFSALATSCVISATPLPLDETGLHVFPDGF